MTTRTDIADFVPLSRSATARPAAAGLTGAAFSLVAFALALVAAQSTAAAPHVAASLPPHAVAVPAPGGEATGAVLQAAAMVPPQAWIVEQVGGSRVSVHVVLTEGESPHSYDPTPRQLTALRDVHLLFRTGLPMEDGLLPRVARSFPGIEVVDLRDGLDLIPDRHDHGHSSRDDHGHDAGLDPHVWLDPELVAGQVRTVARVLARRDPPGAAYYAANRDSVLARLERLERDLHEILDPVRGREMLVFHPAFGYLAQAFGLVQTSLEEGGLAPTPRHLADVITRARERGVSTLFVQPQHAGQAVDRVGREMDVEVVELDVLARDLPDNLRRMARAIRDGLTR
ncbi:MAG: zinc ABC transporter substrate-binding protein [Candidatus Krumholzibacteriia bacterium]